MVFLILFLIFSLMFNNAGFRVDKGCKASHKTYLIERTSFRVHFQNIYESYMKLVLSIFIIYLIGRMLDLS